MINYDDQMANQEQAIANDPPRSHFNVIASTRAPKITLLHGNGTQDVDKLLKDVTLARVLSTAVVTSIDRASGALAANDTSAVTAQNRLALAGATLASCCCGASAEGHQTGREGSRAWLQSAAGISGYDQADADVRRRQPRSRCSAASLPSTRRKGTAVRSPSAGPRRKENYPAGVRQRSSRVREPREPALASTCLAYCHLRPRNQTSAPGVKRQCAPRTAPPLRRRQAVAAPATPLHMQIGHCARRCASPALGDERASDEAGPHNRIRHGRAAAAGLRLGDVRMTRAALSVVIAGPRGRSSARPSCGRLPLATTRRSTAPV